MGRLACALAYGVSGHGSPQEQVQKQRPFAVCSLSAVVHVLLDKKCRGEGDGEEERRSRMALG